MAVGLDRVRPTLTQISFDLQKDLIVVEQPIQLGQLGLKAQLQRGDQGKQVDWCCSIS
jgi:hypothetical protein